MQSTGILRLSREEAGIFFPVSSAAALFVAVFLSIVLTVVPAPAGQYDDLPWTLGEGTVTLGEQSHAQAKEQSLALARAVPVRAAEVSTAMGAESRPGKVSQSRSAA